MTNPFVPGGAQQGPAMPMPGVPMPGGLQPPPRGASAAAAAANANQGGGGGINAGNYIRLRPAPIWRGGPDGNGQVVKGSESYRDFAHRVERWVMTGVRVGVAEGLLASEFSDALPEGPKKLLRGVPNAAILADGRPPGMMGMGDPGEPSGLEVIYQRLNFRYLDQQGDHAQTTEDGFEKLKRKPGETMAQYRANFQTGYEDAQRESAYRYGLSAHSLTKRLLDGALISALERFMITTQVGGDLERLGDIDAFLQRFCARDVNNPGPLDQQSGNTRGINLTMKGDGGVTMNVNMDPKDLANPDFMKEYETEFIGNTQSCY
jgi:hypothetical protein